MSIQINDGFEVNAPRAADLRVGKIVSGKTVPFSSTSEANSSILSANRYIGLTVLITVSGVTNEYWYKNGITNGDLVLKSSAQVQSNWTESNNTLPAYIQNKPSLATVATTGSYNDLSNTPTIPVAGWGLTGNSLTDDTVQFLGTTSTKRLVFKVDNTRAGYIDPNSGDYLTNVALGVSTMNPAVVTSIGNTAIGFQALGALTDGANNTAIGFQTLKLITTANNNTAIGNLALSLSTTGSNNTSLGNQAGYSSTTGSNNTVLGYAAGFNITTGSYNVVIGAGINTTDPTSSNQLLIGANGTTWISGDTGVISIPNLSGSGSRIVEADSTSGTLTATNIIDETFVTDSDVISAITGATYNSGNNYQASITPASLKIFYKGQMYKQPSSPYLYLAISNNVSFRISGA